MNQLSTKGSEFANSAITSRFPVAMAAAATCFMGMGKDFANFNMSNLQSPISGSRSTSRGYFQIPEDADLRSGTRTRQTPLWEKVQAALSLENITPTRIGRADDAVVMEFKDRGGSSIDVYQSGVIVVVLPTKMGNDYYELDAHDLHLVTLLIRDGHV